ncbi:MAG TPA: bifunctional salicylyl-CoA 5-hydroxylase/oxidoreductase [Gemmatimonadales bacterium]
MKIDCIGGGPAGLYFAILMKKADPRNDITVYERNRPDDTFGFGVVFSDATQGNLAQADRETFDAWNRACARWDDIHIHVAGQLLTSTGHGFSGLSREALLRVLVERCRALGVRVHFEYEVYDLAAHRDCDVLVASDGFSSTVREQYHAQFQPDLDWRPNRFVWLGTTRPFPAFTFYFREDEHGLWRVHAYQYEAGHSTFIVETTETTWRASGMDAATEDETLVFCERLFAEELAGHPLLKNRSIWRNFATVRNAHWSHENVVLIGDAAHTAHFSVGSGTKLGMEDGIALAQALTDHADVPGALAAYEADRRPAVESLQRAAQVSLEWFEDAERYMDLDPIQFGFNLLTRSFRITHDNLKLRDPGYIDRVDRWFAARAGSRQPQAPPPLLTPFRLRDLMLDNRVVVSPMCQYRAVDGCPNEWHLVHLGSRAIGGAGLVFSEMTDVSADARITPGCAGMYAPAHVDAWRRVVDFVHRESDAKVGMQLGHAGRKGATRPPWEGADVPLTDGTWPLLAPSPLPYLPHCQVPKAMDRADMDRVRGDFVRAAGMADEAGFDMLELHYAHGYLLATFISPLTNQRTDAYGGSVENRMRFPLEVFHAVRAIWPERKPISVRISAVDWVPGGMEAADAVEVATLLKAAGCDIIDVSAGQTVAHQRPEYGRQFQTPFSNRIRHEVGIPTMAVGNISSYMDVNTILVAGRADLCVLARAHLWDPYWTRHAAQALGHACTWPDPYESMNTYKPRFE